MFNKIAIVRKLDDTSVVVSKSENSVLAFCAMNDIECFVYDSAAMIDKDEPILFVSIGGDGTMLYAVKESIKFSNSSVLGISAGRLNFLTDRLNSTEICGMLTRILNGDSALHIDERMLVLARVAGHNIYALNEIFLSPLAMNTMMRYTIDINGKRLASQGGSGVLVATPTGSTAFAMSSGGAIMSPTSRELQVVPVASHSLSSRPVIVSGNDKITLTTTPTERVPIVQLIGDGQVLHTFDSPEDVVVTITAASRVARIWRNDDWNFFDVLAEKMNWST